MDSSGMQATRRWRKYVPRIVMLLALGALVNVLVSWGCAIWSDAAVAIERGVPWGFSPVPNWRSVERVSPLDPFLDPGPDSARQWWLFRQGFGLDRRALVAEVDMTSPGFGTMTPNIFSPLPTEVTTKAGWPWLSFQARQWLDSNKPPNQPYSYDSKLVITTGVSVSGEPPARRVLPIRPLWKGFAANTLLFAACLWMAFMLLQVMKQMYRARGNCCCECGYPIGQSPMCSECGADIQRHGNRLQSQRRMLHRFVVCLPIGGVLSAVAAWLCALYAPLLYSSSHVPLTSEEVWWTQVSSGSIASERRMGLGFKIDVFYDGFWGCHLIRGGWPLSACEHAVEYWESGPGGVRAERVHHGKTLPRWLEGPSWDRKYLSMRVNWSALAVNALAWSALLAAMAQLLAMMRKRDTLSLQ